MTMKFKLTTLSNCSRSSQVSILPIHVVGSSAGVIAQPNAEVFHFHRLLLIQLRN